MPALLFSVLGRFAPWIVAAVLLLGVGLYGWHLHAALRTADAALHVDKGTIAQLEAVNARNRAELARLAATAAAWQVALTTAETSDARAGMVAERLLTTIAGTPAHDDGPVAPVLGGTLAAIARAQRGETRAPRGGK